MEELKQEAKHSTESSITQKALDTISRQAALDELKRISFSHWFECGEYLSEDTKEIKIISATKALEAIENLPPATSTLCGYNIEHLILIADVLRKEDLPPERITDVLTDIGRIVSMVTDEFEESLRKAAGEPMDKIELHIHERICPVCGKIFICYKDTWVYKRQPYLSPTIFFCSWSCLNKYDANRLKTRKKRGRQSESTTD